jgi:YVTN family beta-propeller protein
MLTLACLLGPVLAWADNGVGKWLSPASNNWPLISVHAALTPDGRVLTYGTDGTGRQTGYFIYDVWDPSQGLSNGHVTLDNMTLTDLFCSSQVVLPQSGSIFIAGGDNWTGTSTTNSGNNNSNTFRYTDNTLSRGTNMNRARWYSSATVLVNGEVYIQGGSSGGDRPEVRQLDGSFRLLSGVNTNALAVLFPRNFLAPDGRVFGYDTNGVMYYVNAAGTGQYTGAGQFSSSYAGWTSSAAMFRPGKILQVGGNSNGAIVIDVTSGTPVVTPTQSMSTKRQWVSATVLADGRVLATGGSTDDNQLIGVNNTAEVWNPATGQWTVGPSGSRARLYHSSALLLPDASVLVTGGGAPGPLVNLHSEIYYPSYLLDPAGNLLPRPTIVTAPDSIEVGQDFSIGVGSANISRLTFVKTGSVTHSVNMDQRFIELPFSDSSGTLFVQAPDSAAEMPPGYYLLFAFDAAGVPSVAKIVRVNIPANPVIQVDYTTTMGGTGGSPFQLSCNADETLVGIYGNSAGTYVNRAGLQCVKFDELGQWIGDPVNRGAAGSATGTAYTRTCPRNMAVSGYRGRGSAYVDQIDVECKAVTSAGRTTGAGQYLGAVGGSGGTAQGPFSCSTGNPVYSLAGRSGSWLDAIGMLCRAAPITRTNVNTPPTVTPPGNQVGSVGTFTSLAISASDANADVLSYGTTGLPTGLTIAPTTGVISGTPSATGTFSVTVSVGDGQATTTTSFTWTINDQDPLVLDPMPQQPPRLVNTAVTYTAASRNGVNTQYKWYFDDGSETGWSASPSVTHTFSRPTIFWVAVTAKDDRGIEQTQTFSQMIHLPLTAQKPAVSGNLALAGGRLWVVNQDNDTVSVFDLASNQKLAEIPVGGAPRAIAVAPDGNLWVTNRRSSSINRIDAVTLAVTGTSNLAPGSRPFGLVFAPDGSAAYVALEAAGRVLRLDPATGVEVGSAAVGPTPRHLSISADGSKLYVSRFITPPLPGESTATVATQDGGVERGGEVLVLNPGTLGAIGVIVLRHSDDMDFENSGSGVPNYLGPVVISPDGMSAWVPSKKDNVKRGTLRSGGNLNHQNTVRSIGSRIDLTTQAEDFGARLDFDNASLASAAAYDRYGVFLFVALETSREVAVVDAHNHVEFFRINVGRAPQGLAVSPDGYKLYVSNFMDRTVSVYDLTRLINEGQWQAPLLGTLQSVATEKLSATVLAGKQFFYDARDSRRAREGYMSCASCHNDGEGDGRVWDLTGMGEGLRNTIALRGRAATGHGFMHWTANFDELQDFEGQIRSLAGGTGLMTDAQFNTGTRSQPLGDTKAGQSADLDALAAYVASLNAFDRSPHRNADGSLTADGVAGRTIFIAQGCASCHGGSNFSDSGAAVLHDVGTIRQPTSGKRLNGALTGLDSPTLRDVWATAPYLHDGSAATLGAAVRAHSGVSIGDADLAKLVAYLQQIDGLEPAVSVTPPVVLSGGDIGWTSAAGSYGVVNGVHTVKGAGADIWGSGDRFYFAYQQMSGDGEIVARILSQTNTDPWAKAGVMIRENLSSGSRNATMLATPANGLQYQNRQLANKRSYTVAAGNGAAAPPVWLRLKRVGDVIQGYYSNNGVDWTLVSSTTLTGLPQTIYVGLAVCSRVSTTLSTAQFDNVSIGSVSAPPPPPVDTTPPTTPANLRATSVAQTQVALAWDASTDPAPGSGIARYEVSANGAVVGTSTGTTYTAGSLTAGTNYSFSVVAIDGVGLRSAASTALPVTTANPPDTTPPGAPSNLRLTAVNETQATIAWDAAIDPAPGSGIASYEIAVDGVVVGSTAAITFTIGSLAPGTAYSVTVIAIDGVGLRSAASTVLPVSTTAPPPVDTVPPLPPTNLRATSVSQTQVALAWDAATDPAPGSGIAMYEISVDGVVAGTSATTTFVAGSLTANTAYSFTVVAIDGGGLRSPVSTSLPVTTAAAAQPLTLTGLDIGYTGVAGSYSVANDVHTVRGAGGDIWGSGDRFYYAYQAQAGDFEVVARVLSQQNTNAWAKAGLVVRENLTQGARNAAMLVTPSSGELFQNRPVANARTYSTGSANPTNTAPIWLRLRRVGNVLTGFHSSDGVTWTQVSSVTLSALPQTVYVGLGVTSKVQTVLSTVVFDMVQMRAPVGP